jgi:general L-amino acid transport system substrate-binding protein
MFARWMAALFAPLLLIPALASAQVAPPAAAPVPSPILDRIRAAKTLNCGVAKEEEDFGRAEDHGNRAALDLDVCKAVAVAILGPGAHFVVKPYPEEPAALDALRKGEIDFLATASPGLRSAAAGFAFARPVFYDGGAVMVKNDPAVKSPVDLAGKKICFVITTPTEQTLHEYAADHHIEYIWYPFSEEGEMYAAFFGANCAGLAGDVTKLANVRGIARSRALDYTILPERMSEEPLAPATLASDPRMAAVLDWTVAILIDGEAYGVSSKNVRTLLANPPTNVPFPDTRVLRTLGQKFGPGTEFGLDAHWGANVIEAVGNYAELYDRDLGPNSPMHLERGPNRLSRDGGLLEPVLP